MGRNTTRQGINASMQLKNFTAFLDKKNPSKIYKANGEVVEVKPKNNKYFTLEEMQTIVGGYIQIVTKNSNTVMVINEEGKLDNLPYNKNATEIISPKLFLGDVIVGDVLVCNPKFIK